MGLKFCMNCGTELPGAPVPVPPPPVAAKLVLPSRREIVLSEPETIVGRGDFLQDLSHEKAFRMSHIFVCLQPHY